MPLLRTAISTQINKRYFGGYILLEPERCQCNVFYSTKVYVDLISKSEHYSYVDPGLPHSMITSHFLLAHLCKLHTVIISSNRIITYALASMILREISMVDGVPNAPVQRSFSDEIFESLYLSNAPRPPSTNTSANDLSQRALARTPGLVSYIAPSTHSSDSISVNISVDVSGCGKSVMSRTIAGIYTHVNGTIRDNATVGDILADLAAVQKGTPDIELAESLMWSHTLISAQMVQTESEALLDEGLICNRGGSTSMNVPTHVELRRLVWWWITDQGLQGGREFAWLIGSSAFGGLPAA